MTEKVKRNNEIVELVRNSDINFAKRQEVGRSSKPFNTIRYAQYGPISMIFASGAVNNDVKSGSKYWLHTVAGDEKPICTFQQPCRYGVVSAENDGTDSVAIWWLPDKDYAKGTVFTLSCYWFNTVTNPNT